MQQREIILIPGTPEREEAIVQNPARPDLHQLPTTAIVNWDIIILGFVMIVLSFIIKGKPHRKTMMEKLIIRY